MFLLARCRGHIRSEECAACGRKNLILDHGFGIYAAFIICNDIICIQFRESSCATSIRCKKGGLWLARVPGNGERMEKKVPPFATKEVSELGFFGGDSQVLPARVFPFSQGI